MTVLVRLMRDTDIEAFWSVLDAVASEKKFLGNLRAPPLSKLRDFVLEHIDHNQPQYVAEMQGQLVGWADITPATRDATRHIGTLGMGVLEPHRGRGIGRRLLEAAIEHAWSTGLKRIELEVFVDNAAAVALYEKLGFAHEGRLRMARLIDDVYRDVYRMALLHPQLEASPG